MLAGKYAPELYDLNGLRKRYDKAACWLAKVIHENLSSTRKNADPNNAN